MNGRKCSYPLLQLKLLNRNLQICIFCHTKGHNPRTEKVVMSNNELL